MLPRLWTLLELALAAAPGYAATFQADFATDPLAHGWQVFGDTNLFQWNVTNQNVAITWDSSQGNSCFQMPLGTIVTRDDDFSFALDLRLDDVSAGIDPGKPSTFELAFGLQNSVSAEKTNFFRGNARNAPNLAEFDFFPDTGYGPTVWPAAWSTNSAPNYNGPSDYTILDLPLGVVMRVSVDYSASAGVLTTTIATNGTPLASVHPVPLSPGFTDFRLGTFALESYSDAGQSGPLPGSILAHGAVDNVVITAPPPPVAEVSGAFTNGSWQLEFLSRIHWLYTLERTTDFQSWLAVSATVDGSGTNLVLQDSQPPVASACYRVRAERP